MKKERQLKCVIIGSFKKYYTEIVELISSLDERYTVLSPQKSWIIDMSTDFVLLDSDIQNAAEKMEMQVHYIESKVLENILDASFIYLYNPLGYIGVSTAFEVGYAYKAGKKIYAAYLPTDIMLANFINRIITPAEICEVNIDDE